MTFMPPFGPPSGPPLGPPFGPTPGPPGTVGPQGPTEPPPAFEPTMTAFAVDPRAISRCLFRYTFIWLNNGNRFWFYPTFVGNVSVAGFRWTGRFWLMSGISLREISSFSCF
ncbi:transporter [Paenibacillus lutimineralis]|uniref:Transporter n=1 Tax=Paenibacillus lutimineralis TaxID=2707005 RepID=A0A3Q9IEZ4_9BACL|nr:transporter [Paenibacillus lutimineralis]